MSTVSRALINKFPLVEVMPPADSVKSPEVVVLKLIGPLPDVSKCATVRPAEPTSVMVPLVVVSVPFVASVPPLLSRSIEPVPVLNAKAGNVSVPVDLTVIGAFAPSVGAASVTLPV
ncbi:MAG: hypothetical protein K8S22_15975, partial [Betaproteobacteria bacterium]|nr:hypothetical protein [Betaproteobacteria bacterium]